MKKPIYIIDFLVSGCNHKFILNDVVISESSDGDQISAQLKINEWLKNGLNKLTVEITPFEKTEELNPHAIGAFEVSMRDSNAPDLNSSVIKSGRTSQFNNLSDSELTKVHSTHHSFSIQLPFDESAFHRSKPFELEKDRLNITEVFRNIWKLHKEQNWYALAKLEDRKIQELATCYFEQPNTLRQLNRANFEATIMDGYQLVDFNEEFLEIQLVAEGKLATVVDSEGFPAIFYDHQDGTKDLYSYWVFRNENDDIQIIR